MKKIPTIFERDWTGDRSRVVNQIHEGCEWVFDGEGIATRKIDGTCCMIEGGRLFKRREVKHTQKKPADFIEVDVDFATGKTVGWVPVGDGPEDRWHREATPDSIRLPDGTYELIGPKVQGNPEEVGIHHLVRHGDLMAGPLHDVPRSFNGLKDWLARHDYEGIVFHHPDGRMAKIKRRDFGMKRG